MYKPRGEKLLHWGQKELIKIAVLLLLLFLVLTLTPMCKHEPIANPNPIDLDAITIGVQPEKELPVIFILQYSYTGKPKDWHNCWSSRGMVKHLPERKGLPYLRMVEISSRYGRPMRIEEEITIRKD